jgi:carbon storage regulator
MLVLARRVGESVIIGDGADAVKVTVASIRGSEIRLGFDAPDSIHITRAELLPRDQEEA